MATRSFGGAIGSVFGAIGETMETVTSIASAARQKAEVWQISTVDASIHSASIAEVDRQSEVEALSTKAQVTYADYRKRLEEKLA